MKSALLLAFAFSVSAHALETDQFLATRAVIKDSSEVLNRYFNQQIEKAVAVANEGKIEKIKCQQVASNVMNNLVGAKYFGISKISKFARTNPEIEKFPDMSVSDKDYFRMTFYENSDILMKFADLARTINVDGVYMGTDKLGHFSLIGRNYYHNYLTYKKKGQKQEEAMRNAILKGFATERGILGYAIGGVLSFGDLEANYQGMKFAIEVCEGSDPYVKFENGKFKQVRTFETKNYFSPRMDESFHFSFWRPGLYKRIQPKLAQSYCEIKNDPMYIERISKYPALVENLNDRLIKEVIFAEKRFDRGLEDVKSFCNE